MAQLGAAVMETHHPCKGQLPRQKGWPGQPKSFSWLSFLLGAASEPLRNGKFGAHSNFVPWATAPPASVTLRHYDTSMFFFSIFRYHQLF